MANNLSPRPARAGAGGVDDAKAGDRGGHGAVWRARTGATPLLLALAALLLTGTAAHASDADLPIPNLEAGSFHIFGAEVNAWWLLFWGAMVITGTLGISLYLRAQIHRLPAHSSQLNVAETIYQTCKTYLLQQGKFLLMLFVLIAAAMSYYLLGFGHETGYAFTDRERQEVRQELIQKKVGKEQADAVA